ncbi:hypothetical protein GCM10009584_29870 [Ornithinimicrobium humiphilum]|uniref:Membrane protein DedA with SNARE-associated domain n=1 Tax=Ornithinimicrobium humiphilum TaxID=125288 RepID=A0A543K6K6_9MICO|nr:VTT domain-containing protein [Ornithinimicrobium humiphilum]TQM90717.1 membrane protein DedA with SNARE-associated domain [Ornithinimicrobium humiphilum]
MDTVLAGATGSEGFFWERHGFAVAFGFLLLVAMARGQATYWIARVVTEQTLRRTAPTTGWKAAVHTWLSGEGVARGRASIHRWGLVVIPLCYLTVGFQTLVLGAAGLLRIPWPTFTLAQLPGAAAWALIYSTIGLAVWAAAVGALAREPLAIAGLVAVVVVVASTVLWRRHQRRAVESV